MTPTQALDSAQQTAPAEVPGWSPTTFGLRISFSYLKLCELKFRGLEDQTTFNPASEKVTDVQPVMKAVPQGYDLFVQRHRLLASRIPTIQRFPKLIRYAPRQLLHFYTDLRGGKEQAFRSMSSKTRSTLQRKVRNYRTFCGGEIRWSVYKTPEEMLRFHGLARQVAAKTYQERLFDASLPDSQEFRDEMLRLAERDLVRGFLLFHESRPVAYLYTPAMDGFLVYDFLGYDPDYHQHSPGTVLQYLALEGLYAEQRFPFFYWGFGYSQTKQVFSTGQALAADVLFFRSTLRNRLLIWLHYTTDQFSERIGALLERVNLKRPIKRWIKKL